LKVEKDEQPLTLAEVFRSVSDGVWSDLPAGDAKVTSSVTRRNLQREHLRMLTDLTLGKKTAQPTGMMMMFIGAARSAPPDARSLARLHLREIQKRIGTVLTDEKVKGLDDTTRAHLEESQDRIAKVLNASMQVNEP
jgi:hypothetical protein